MRERLMQYMIGRNGNDALNRFLLVVDLLLLLLSSFFRNAIGRILMLLALLCLALTWFRMLSRDLIRRSDENTRYLRLRNRVTAFFRVRKERWIQRKEYKFFACPSCRATMRVPRGRGKVRIVCRKCGTSFNGKT